LFYQLIGHTPIPPERLYTTKEILFAFLLGLLIGILLGFVFSSGWNMKFSRTNVIDGENGGTYSQINFEINEPTNKSNVRSRGKQRDRRRR
jgi:hypothetical protein